MSSTSTAQKRAVAAASMSTHRRWRLGATVVKGGRVLAIGVNRPRNDPSVIPNDVFWECSVHAEADAIRRAGSTKGARLFVARLTRGGRLALARPCDRCMEVIRDAGIQRVVYTRDDGTWASLRL